MMKTYQILARRIAPIVAAGMLLQAGSCSLDTTALTNNLVGIVTSNLIGNLVFGALGVGF